MPLGRGRVHLICLRLQLSVCAFFCSRHSTHLACACTVYQTSDMFWRLGTLSCLRGFSSRLDRSCIKNLYN